MKACIRSLGLGFTAAAAILVSACGGGGGSAAPVTKIGVFADSRVEGLTYVIGAKTAQTDASGQFTYEEGQTITFKVGGIVLGSATASAFMSPVSLVSGATDESNTTVTNIAKFLQTIDDDNDPNNGIQLTSAIHNAALGRSIDFTLSDAAYDVDPAVTGTYAALIPVSSTPGAGHTAVSAATAKNHLRNTLLTALSGTYSGSYAGSNSGTFSINISTSGVITGTGNETSPAPANFSVTGTVASSGTTNFASGAAGIATFTGSVNISTGTLAGTWTSSGGTRTGTYSGRK